MELLYLLSFGVNLFGMSFRGSKLENYSYIRYSRVSQFIRDVIPILFLLILKIFQLQRFVYIKHKASSQKFLSKF